ncbi:MAG: T9SS type A sorting domain-containing protein [Ignavibacteriaceae bacterium]|nr:T9SS type A sorting domain-containing protein [Ignavibacteriaceae bacterium]
MIVYDDKIIAATSDGLWQRDTSEVITALEEQNKSPQEFKLFQNYPNPFNPKTSIQYVIGSCQFVTLKVYDVLGNEVATLVDQEQAAGSYEINFEADGFKSGIYFYTLNAGSFTQTKKLVLLK